MANEEVTDDQLFRFYDLMFRAQIRLQNDAYQISDLVDKMNGIIDRTEPDSLRQNYSFKIYPELLQQQTKRDNRFHSSQSDECNGCCKPPDV